MTLINQEINQQTQPIDWPDGIPLTADALLAQGRFFTPAEVLSNAPRAAACDPSSVSPSMRSPRTLWDTGVPTC